MKPDNEPSWFCWIATLISPPVETNVPENDCAATIPSNVATSTDNELTTSLRIRTSIGLERRTGGLKPDLIGQGVVRQRHYWLGLCPRARANSDARSSAQPADLGRGPHLMPQGLVVRGHDDAVHALGMRKRLLIPSPWIPFWSLLWAVLLAGLRPPGQDLYRLLIRTERPPAGSGACSQPGRARRSHAVRTVDRWAPARPLRRAPRATRTFRLSRWWQD